MNKKTSFKRQFKLLLVTGLLASATGTVVADSTDMKEGGNQFDLEKVAICVSCHGADGIGKANHYPDLQGKPVAYIVSQLQYFKSGLRKNSAMNVVARSLSEEDMQMLAEFFNQVK